MALLAGSGMVPWMRAWSDSNSPTDSESQRKICHTSARTPTVLPAFQEQLTMLMVSMIFNRQEAPVEAAL